MATDSGGGAVTYTVKELLGKLEEALTQGFQSIDKRLNTIDGKLDDKASNLRVAALEERVSRLELKAAGTAALSTFQRWAVGSIGAAVIGALVYILFGGAR
ncbi:MAG TPA: hypothetical protein VFH56_00140 [Acidimicrobiales bacterium]|nr:hypothetical protein [Acidimicrobiales bacterium]